MKKFEFPLESVLRLRRFREAEARQSLAEAIARRNQAETALTSTHHRISDETHSLQERLPALQAAEVQNAYAELDRLHALALKQARVLADCETEAAARRDDYLAAQRERKPLDNLKESLRQEHLREAEKQEQAVCDELAMIGFSRKGAVP